MRSRRTVVGSSSPFRNSRSPRGRARTVVRHGDVLPLAARDWLRAPARRSRCRARRGRTALRECRRRASGRSRCSRRRCRTCAAARRPAADCAALSRSQKSMRERVPAIDVEARRETRRRDRRRSAPPCRGCPSTLGSPAALPLALCRRRLRCGISSSSPSNVKYADRDRQSLRRRLRLSEPRPRTAARRRSIAFASAASASAIFVACRRELRLLLLRRQQQRRRRHLRRVVVHAVLVDRIEERR